MMTNSRIAGACLILFTTISCCNNPGKPSINRATETALIEKSIHNSIGWAKTKDFKLLYSVFANDSVLDDINEYKGNPASWVNVRWTGVLEKRAGNWVIVQMHFSKANI
jgi:hypothetical protein